MAKEYHKYKLPNSWTWVNLEEILDTTSGGTPSRKRPDYYKGTIPWVKSGELNYNLITDTEEKITNEALENSSAKLFPKGTLLIALYGATVGRLAFLGIDATTNQAVCGIFQNKYVNQKYIYYCLMHQYSFLISLSAGGAQPNISQSVVRKVNIPLSPLYEQNRIVEKLDELLSELEKGKEQLQTSLEQLKVYRQSILKYAFEGKLSEEWRSKQEKLKTPDELVAEIKAYKKQQYEKQLKEYKIGKIKVKPKEPKEIYLPTNVELKEKPELPKGWTYIALSEIVENDSTKISPSKESKLKFVGMDCIEPHTLKPFKYHEFSDFKSAGNYFEKDRILYGRMRPYLNKVWRSEFAGACSGEFLVLHPIPVLNPDFLKYKLHSSEYVTFAMNNISGDRPRISYEEVVSYIFPICSVEEQEEIINQIERLFSLNDVMEKTINDNLLKSEPLKQSLLHKAFEGKLVEQDPKDEPASVLLERIKKEREEYLKSKKEIKKTKKPFYKKSGKMAEELKQIIDILKVSKEPVSAKILWQSSVHKDDIDEFYAMLKKHIESGDIIELPRKGKESFLKLANEK